MSNTAVIGQPHLSAELKKQFAQDPLEVRIISPKGVTYQGKALAVSSHNPQGRFDIIPHHSHFISLINESIMIYDLKDEVQTFELHSGVLRCYNNTVEIYLDIETL